MKGIKKQHRSEMSPQINSQGPPSDLPRLHVADKLCCLLGISLLRDTVEFVKEHCIEFIHPITAL